MKKYLISVNGTKYEVDVEEISSSADTTATTNTSANSSQNNPTPAPAAVVKPVVAGHTGSEKITAPMPGTILKVNAAVGQAVKSGEVLCVLEAMKMENDIAAPRDGKVASVNTAKGTSVNAGDVLVTLE